MKPLPNFGYAGWRCGRGSVARPGLAGHSVQSAESRDDLFWIVRGYRDLHLSRWFRAARS
jgi:hypothetical protein